jgi:hypothetical protein
VEVTFKLTVAQAAAARAQIVDEETGNGNLIKVEDGGYGVSPQYLNFDSSNGGFAVTFKGVRTALRNGMGRAMAVLIKIAGGDKHQLKVVEYKTSDAMLAWWELTEETLGRRKDEDLSGLMTRYGTSLNQAIMEEAEKRSDKKLAAAIAAGNYRITNAGWTAPEINRQQALNKCLSWINPAA